jgi:hypothetical protein
VYHSHSENLSGEDRGGQSAASEMKAAQMLCAQAPLTGSRVGRLDGSEINQKDVCF